MRRALCLALLLVTCGALGCAGEIDATPAGDVGHLQIPLTTSADDGATYVLSTAIFDCYGPTTESFVAPDDGTDISAAVALGDYSIVLRDGWQLSRRQDDGTLVPVVAELASKNPLPVRVLPSAATNAAFEFLLGGGGGTLRISFGVATRVAVIAGHLHVDSDLGFDAQQNPIADGFTGLTGQDADYEARFAIDHAETQPSDGGNGRVYFGRATRLSFSGDPSTPLAGQLARELGGNPMVVTLRITPSGIIMVAELRQDDASGSLVFEIGPVHVDAAIDATGYPVLPPGIGQLVPTEPGGIKVRRLVRVSPNVQNVVGSMVATGDVFVQL